MKNFAIIQPTIALYQSQSLNQILNLEMLSRIVQIKLTSNYSTLWLEEEEDRNVTLPIG